MPLFVATTQHVFTSGFRCVRRPCVREVWSRWIPAFAGIHLSANRFARAVLFALAFVPAAISESPAGATVSGVVRYEGEVPVREFADNEGKHRPVLAVHQATHGLADVMVYLKSTEAEGKPSAAAPLDNKVTVIQQEDYAFVPRVVGVRPGQKVAVGNRDYANHNVRTTAFNAKNAFNVMTPADGMHEHVIEAEPTEKPIRLSCDIHPWMSGWIFVFDHDRFAATGNDGRFHIDDVSPGTYALVVIQPDGRLEAETELTLREDTRIEVSVTFTTDHLGRGNPGTIRIEGELEP